jgi:hypothetical protein
MSISNTGPSDWDLGPLVVKPKTAWRMLQCSHTRGYELLATGELVSFRDGRSRKITVDSIRRYIARRLDPVESLNTKSGDHRRNRRHRDAQATKA